MSRGLAIVTGHSRGLGAALAEALLQRGHRVLGLSRRGHADLGARRWPHGAELEQWPADLADPVPVADRLDEWLRGLDAASFESATLINNAAMLTPPGPIDRRSARDIADGVRVGLEAPLLLVSAFLRATREWPARRRVLNISSGLGRRGMAAQSIYCAVKAGLDNASRAMALDEAARPNGARIVSLAPGVIDTDMQTQLRSADPDGFPDQGAFIGMKTGGQLLSPADAAARVLAYLAREDFGANPVADIRDPAK
jgi:NAD(P)-dependent dehydrogenase (short-subunit alcohol dehydrogenase family)